MAVITTGFFDGVHLGHRHLLETVVSSARERGEEAVVVTFWPHPRTVLQQDARDLRLLSSLEEKKALLLEAGIDRVEVLPFTRAFASMTAREYLQMLRERFGATLVVMGYDNRIGSDRRTAKELTECVIADEYVMAGSDRPSVSSTQIRNALKAGDIDTANAMLGYRYGLHGVVVAGNRLGRTIGFPTANMKLYEPLKLVPAGGVYAVDVQVLGRNLKGMCNIGVRPTVGATNGLTIETNIFDFDEDIYGLDITISFSKRIREERKFASLEDLKAQLLRDKQTAALLPIILAVSG